jgi:hypothetical protein
MAENNKQHVLTICALGHRTVCRLSTPCVGSCGEYGNEFDKDPATFHESLCRKSFEQQPVFGITKGCKAQRVLLHGGTLDNGKVAVEWRWSHGLELRELIARKRFECGEVVTCYGGFAIKAPVVSEDEVGMDSHMRQIPGTDYVLEGAPFSNCFPVKQGAMFDLGYSAGLWPKCDHPGWAKVIASSGIGYMANTVTKCPLSSRRTRTNVTVDTAVLGRTIPGVPFDSILYMRANMGGINPGEPIISPYEQWKVKEKFKFQCIDKAHYEASGSLLSSDEDSEEEV